MIAQDAGLAAGIKTYAEEITKDVKAVTRITPDDGVVVIDTPSANATTDMTSPIQFGGSKEDLKAIYDQQNHFDEDVNKVVSDIERFFNGIIDFMKTLGKASDAASFSTLALILGGVLLLKIILD